MTVEEFLANVVAKSNQHRCLYHFTDKRNLPSIRQKGLLSYKQIKRQEIAVVAFGGNQWSRDADEIFGMDHYVHLCFFDEHPMEYVARNEKRIEDSVFLQISPEILRIEGVKITLDVSNKSGVAPLTLGESLEKMDTEVIYERTNWKDETVRARLNAARKYEVLVPECVPVRFIRVPGNG